MFVLFIMFVMFVMFVMFDDVKWKECESLYMLVRTGEERDTRGDVFIWPTVPNLFCYIELN